MSEPIKTRFAPSPTGLIHLGNARTALFSALYARGRGGSFLLRIEDSDAERSRGEFVAALEEELLWLGLDWQEGPGRDGAAGPYAQSGRGALYDRRYRQLEAAGHAYPCFCSSEELEWSRKGQLARGEPPRYTGRCARLTPEQVDARLAEGRRPTLRFRVPPDREVRFDDGVRGPQNFRTADIGDFVIRRADGTPAFFFCNAVDDALMGVTDVLRGEDHLANTPRQILLLEALGLPVPRYAHLPLITGADGAPLSKRNGSRSVQELREEGYLPLAVVNYLARLGHTYDSDALLSLAELGAGFDLVRVGRSPARFDGHQLLHWQHQALAAADETQLWHWLGPTVANAVPATLHEEFLACVRPNISFPAQALMWAQRIFGDELDVDAAAQQAIDAAGGGFFTAAVEAIDICGLDFKALAERVKERTGAKGKQLFMPLRAALTGECGGPEMARLLPLVGAARARARLARWT